MDFQTIETFIVLAKNKNFTQTANVLFLAQSTVTNRINELERELGVKLFSRNNRSVELTNAGLLFLDYARQVKGITDATLTKIVVADKFKFMLRIGSSDSIYDTHLYNIMPCFRNKYADVAVRVTIGQSVNLLEQLHMGLLDVVFSYLPFRSSAYISKVFKCDEMVLVTNANNTKYISGIKKEELLSIDYIMCNFALQEVGQYIRGLFPKYYQFSLEVDDCSKIIPYLEYGESYTFLPRDMARKYVENGSFIEIPLIDFSTPIINSYIVMSKDEKVKKMIGELLEIINI